MNKLKKLFGKILPRPAKNLILFVLKKLTHLKEYPLIKSQPSLHKKALEKVREKAKSGEKVKVTFFVVHSSVWKYEGVYNLFLEDKRFEPVVIICPVVNYGMENMISEMSKAYNLFKDRGYNVIRAYDEENGTYLDVRKEINPDIIFYTNPYKGLIDNRYYITQFRDILTCYVPYAFYAANFNKIWFDSLFQNMVWKIFYETSFHIKMAEECARNNGENASFTGYPGTDYFIFGIRTQNKNVWLNKDDRLKRIVWAPHHSIEDSGWITYSNFLRFHQVMLEIAENYSDRIQIAFKPHPLLKVKLYNHSDWGKERTDNYYNKWGNGLNTQLETDQYLDLFNTSDALIFDSGSFTTEYLYCGKPSLFIISSDKVYEQFNEFGKLALNQHYHAYSEMDIYKFVESMCNGEDAKKEQRIDFYNKYLNPPNGKSATENIYELICNEILEID